MGRWRDEVRRSRRHVRMYLTMACGSFQRPSRRMVWVLVSWRARSVAQPALPLWGRILRWRLHVGGSRVLKTVRSQRE